MGHLPGRAASDFKWRIMAAIFQHGDIVVRGNRRDERGTICGRAKQMASRNFYRVLFPSNPYPVVV